MFVCLELGNVTYADGPFEYQYVKLMEEDLQCLNAFAESSAARPAPITVGDAQQVLQDSYDDEYSVCWSRRWLARTLKVPKTSSGDRADMA